jgi:hypothetical protein
LCDQLGGKRVLELARVHPTGTVASGP